MNQRKTLVVVGNGMVGLEFLIQAVKRSLNIRFAIHVFGDEPRPAYDRIRLTECMQGTSPDELVLRSREWYADHGITLETSTRIESIDPDAHQLTTADGRTIVYDSLVLATGSRPFVPGFPGSDLPGVFTYRTIEDITAIQAACTEAKRAVIIGGGLLGLELAKSVQEQGVATTVVEFAPGLMVRQLNPVASGILHDQITGLGMSVHLSTETTAIATCEGDAKLVVDYKDEDTTSDPADLVVIAAGIRPRDDLARAAELTCSPRGGIVVDDQLQTSHPDIYAIGECAIHKGQVYGLAAPGYHMAEILARRLNGGTLSRFTGFDLSTKLKLAGLDVWTIGDYQADGRTVNRRQGSDYRQLVLRQGQLVGATVIGNWSELPLLQDAVARRVDISANQIKRLERGGSLFGDDLDDPTNWPEQALICTCMQVTRGTLTDAIAAGATSIETLSETTSAGTVCGSCKPMLAQLTGSEIPEEALIRRGNRTLLVVAVAAAILAIPFLVTEIPYDTSIEHGSGLDVLWRDSLLKQITGYTTIGISGGAMLLSVRKRMLRIGDYGWWRAIHAVLGMGALAAMVVHTGFRLGANLNLALSLGFLTLAVLGSASGALSALENRIGGRRVRVLRLWWTRAHIAAFWLVVPLVAFHIAKVYGY